MLYDNEHYTQEQKDAISRIGKKYKDNKENTLKRYNLYALLAVLGAIAVGIMLLALKPNNTVTPIFIGLIAFGTGLYNALKAKKERMKVLEDTDYNVGLYFADKDPQVIGNSKKVLGKAGLAYLIIGIVLVLALIPILMFAFDGEPVDYDSLEIITGKLDSGEIDDDIIEMYIRDDTTKYRITSIYTDVLDVDKIFDEVVLGDNVTFYADTMKVVNGEPVRDIYYFESFGTVYMDEELMLKGYYRNETIGYIVVGVFLIAGIGMISAYIIGKKFIEPRNKAQEIYDLTIKEHDIEQEEDFFKQYSENE